MKSLMHITQRLSALLGDHSVVIGGVCAVLHGSERMTLDVDFASDLDLDTVSKCLTDAGILFTVKKGDLLDVLPWVIHGELDEISFQVMPSQAIGIDIEHAVRSQGIQFAAVEDFIISKCIAGSHQDLHDVAVIVLRNPSLHDFALQMASKHQCDERLNDWLTDSRLLERYAKV